MSQYYILTSGNNLTFVATFDANILIMGYSKISRMLLVFGVLAISATVFGQGRGDGSGNGQGRSGQRMGNTAKKERYKDVKAIQVFSQSGEEIYSSSSKPPKSKDPLPKIEWIDTNSMGVKIFFVTAGPVQRVIDLKCDKCIILIDYLKAKSGSTD